jgi:D-3-phosphoglycerate dehydrogenase
MQAKLSVKRISTSPYFKESFAKLEEKIIHEVADAKMLSVNDAESADVLITNTHTIPALLSPKELKHCQLMIHPNSGYDNFSYDFVSSADFPIIIGNPIRAHAVVNFILSALLEHFSSIPHDHLSWNKTRLWPRQLLSEQKILILGVGHIGSLLIETLKPLVKKLSVYDPYQKHNELDLTGIDVIIPACSLNQKNHHFINRDFLLKLNQHFLLINAARGGLVHTTELISVLKERKNAYAILDVFEVEPCDFSLFSSLPNISLSSHIAGVFTNIDFATANFEAQVILDFQNLSAANFDEKYRTILLKNRLSEDGFLI